MKLIRRSKGITAAFVARQLGVSSSRMYWLENEYYGAKPTALQCQRIAQILGVPVQDIIE